VGAQGRLIRRTHRAGKLARFFLRGGVLAKWIIAICILLAPWLDARASYPTIQAAYDAAQAAMQADEVVWINGGIRTISGAVVFHDDTTCCCWNYQFSYHGASNGGSSGNDVACWTPGAAACGSGSPHQPANGLLSDAPLITGASVCNHGCKATFQCGAVCGVQGGSGAQWNNYGTVTDTSAYCSTSSTFTENDAASDCQGDQCFTLDGAGAAKMCNGSGVCAAIKKGSGVAGGGGSGGAAGGSNNCAFGNPQILSGARAAECAGKPAPTPNPNGDSHNGGNVGDGGGDGGGGPGSGPDSKCPGASATWNIDGSSMDSTAYENCAGGDSCGPGTESVNGQCVGKCPAGQTWNGHGCGSTCPAGQVDRGNGCETVCDSSQVLNGTQCVNSCPSGTTANGTGGCVGSCPSGQSKAADGSCAGSCPSGQTWRAGTGCSSAACPTGTTSQNGVCQPNSCTAGQVNNNGTCSNTCDQGMTAVNGKCEPGNKADGGTDCNAPPVTSGDALLSNIDFQNWKTRCALETTGKPQDSDYGTSHTKAEGFGADDDGSAAAAALDASGWLSSGGCPTLPSMNFMGHSFMLSDWLPCSAMQLIGYLIVLGGYVQAAFILGRR